jgi:methylglutaconyl-CoA hydratase
MLATSQRGKTASVVTPAMASHLHIEKSGAVARVILARADKHNAFDAALIAELTTAFRAVGADADVRIIVLAAEGKSFSAGADLNWMRETAGYAEAENRADAEQLAAMLRALDTLPKPTIAAVQGPVYGGGVGLIAACDIAIGSDAALFALSEARLGLIPAVISPYVVRAMGMRHARRYALTGERFDAKAALAVGLLHEIVPAAELNSRVATVADLLCEAAPGAQGEVKALLRAIEGRPIDPALNAETASWIARVRAGDEAREGIAAFLEKRKPRWAGDRHR